MSSPEFVGPGKPLPVAPEDKLVPLPLPLSFGDYTPQSEFERKPTGDPVQEEVWDKSAPSESQRGVEGLKGA